jgi:hypothetical protein
LSSRQREHGSSDDGTYQDGEEHRQTSEVFDPTVAEAETAARRLPREQECNPERTSGRGIGKIVNRIGKQYALTYRSGAI